MAVKSFNKVLLLSERRDVINFCEAACGPEISLTVDTEFTKIPPIAFELLIFDASLIIGKAAAFYRCLELFSDRLACLLPYDAPFSLRNYVEHKFNYIIPYPMSVENFRERIFSIQSQLLQLLKKNTLTFLENENVPDSVLGYFCGSSSKIKAVRKMIIKAACTRAPVLLLGETGTGKTTAAGLIHTLSDTKGKEMVSYSLSTVVDSLAESTFFGHVKGSYTSAENERIGLLEAADGSTLFLDELGVASLDVQAMLLTFLDTGNFKKVGTQKEQHVDVRMIFATNADLDNMLHEGSFRKDLYFRISDNIIRLPPLREHKEDIKDMVETYIANEGFMINEEALAKMENYNWPGNVRQLYKCLDHAMADAKDNMLYPEHINFGDISFPQ